MAKDDISLGVEMGKLEIEPLKLKNNIKDENPFLSLALTKPKINVFTKTCAQNLECSCNAQKQIKNVFISKKKQHKILKEPVLKLLQTSNPKDGDQEEQNQFKNRKCLSSLSVNSCNSDIINLCTLVDNCNQLRISTSSNVQNLDTSFKRENHWWNNVRKIKRQSEEVAPGNNRAGTCSQEALNPPCDVTIDELASYFETLVHIPKKMSSMAEMMYI